MTFSEERWTKKDYQGKVNQGFCTASHTNIFRLEALRGPEKRIKHEGVTFIAYSNPLTSLLGTQVCQWVRLVVANPVI